MLPDDLREEIAESRLGEEIALVIERTPVPAGKSPIKPLASNDTYIYPISRAMSFYPMKNDNGCAWIEEEIAALVNAEDEELAFNGKFANLNHNKAKNVGAIKITHLIPDVGVDVMTRVDKRAIEAQGLAPEDFRPDGEYNATSIEIFCNFGKSRWIVEKKPGAPISEQQIVSSEEAAALGFRRSLPDDPLGEFRYNGFTVVEAPLPLRLRGHAFTDNPADPNAKTFELAAERGAEQRPHPAPQPPTPKESSMTAEEIAAKVASEVAAKTKNLQDEIASLNGAIANLKTEKTTEITRLQSEHAEALSAVNTELTTTKTALTTKSEELANRIKDELAVARFTALSKVEGFEAGDEEAQKSLKVELRDEDATAFNIRLLTAQNVALTKRIAVGSPKVETAEEKAERENREELAALSRGNIDGLPTYKVDDKGVSSPAKEWDVF